LKGEDATRGLTAVLSVRMADPWFLSARKDRLVSPELRGAVRAGVGRFLREFFGSHPAVAEAIVWAAADGG
jgi:DNA gyrase/topoisomerase IV subunit B